MSMDCFAPRKPAQDIVFFYTCICIIVGDTAVKYLLKGTKFLSNAGLSRVYTKPGGFSKAHEDFIKVNTAKDVVKRPIPGAFYVCNKYLC